VFFLHDKLPKSLIDATNLKFQNLVKISGYSSRLFPQRVEELIKIDLGLDANIEFIKAENISAQDCPKPLYQNTAEQIGILPKRGIPDLIQTMLPKGSPATCKYIVRNLLLNPPPKNYADSLRQVIVELQNNQKQLPMLIVSNPVRYIKTLNKNEAHPEILKDLFCLAEIFLSCESNLSKNFIKNTLESVSYISSIKAENHILRDTSHKITALLSSILPKDEDLNYTPKNELIPTSLFERIEEEFRGRIARTSNLEVENLYDRTNKAAQKYEEILTRDLIAAVQSFSAQKGVKSRKMALTYDIHNHTIWLLGSVSAKAIEEHKLIHPLDRYGKEVRDRFSTKEVEEALQEYKDAAAATYEAIRQVLKQASKDLSPYCLPIIHLATFSNFVKTIYLHIKECRIKNWTTNFESDVDEDNKIKAQEFFPYWMRLGEGVTNSLNFDGTCLLTGHNMSGKSTLIRSLAATTLLASCGFMFPARKVTIAQKIDGWYVRTGANDDPEAGLSAFAVEMTDIKIALRDATPNSFLLIDELGKGTESKAGHAIAASVLEYLAQKNIRSVFATHWHEIFANNEVNLHNVKLIKMHCDGDVPSYKVEEGVDLNSSAFYTAAKVGVDSEIIARAQQISDGYDVDKILKLEDSANIEFDYSFKKDWSQLAKETLSLLAEVEASQIKNLKENETPSLNHAATNIT